MIKDQNDWIEQHPDLIDTRYDIDESIHDSNQKIAEIQAKYNEAKKEKMESDMLSLRGQLKEAKNEKSGTLFDKRDFLRRCSEKVIKPSSTNLVQPPPKREK